LKDNLKASYDKIPSRTALIVMTVMDDIEYYHVPSPMSPALVLHMLILIFPKGKYIIVKLKMKEPRGQIQEVVVSQPLCSPSMGLKRVIFLEYVLIKITTPTYTFKIVITRLLPLISKK
jgi:hypothetical protein